MPTRTRRQREVLDFIIRYIDGHGYEPSYQLIARELGVSSKAGIAKHIKALEEQGLLQRRRENGTFKLDIGRTEVVAPSSFEISWLDAPTNGFEPETFENSSFALPLFMLGDVSPKSVRAFSHHGQFHVRKKYLRRRCRRHRNAFVFARWRLCGRDDKAKGNDPPAVLSRRISDRMRPADERYEVLRVRANT
jgi:hypothetical protein